MNHDEIAIHIVYCQRKLHIMLDDRVCYKIYFINDHGWQWVWFKTQLTVHHRIFYSLETHHIESSLEKIVRLPCWAYNGQMSSHRALGKVQLAKVPHIDPTVWEQMSPWDQNRMVMPQMETLSMVCGLGCLCICDTYVFVSMYADMCVYMTVYGTPGNLLAILIVITWELPNTFYSRLEVALSSN